MTISTSSATWEGGLKSGKGRFEAKSGAFRGEYSFPTRFESASGTNPEELLAAAYASCFSMALSAGLEKDGHPPARISTTAAVTMEKAAEGMRVTRMKVATRGAAPGVDQAGFAAAAEAARDTCPMSHLFKGIQVDLEARVES